MSALLATSISLLSAVAALLTVYFARQNRTSDYERKTLEQLREKITAFSEAELARSVLRDKFVKQAQAAREISDANSDEKKRAAELAYTLSGQFEDLQVRLGGLRDAIKLLIDPFVDERELASHRGQLLSLTTEMSEPEYDSGTEKLLNVAQYYIWSYSKRFR